jgi:lysophospholipase L1-like esterase
MTIWQRNTQTLAVALLALSCASLRAEDAYVSKNPAQRRPGTVVRIDLIGDSTQTDGAGYGRGFCANLSGKVDCLNMARGGASTKTYRELGLWDRSLSTKPDYMLIQFGHNDMESAEHLDRQVPIAVYEKNLRTFVDQARAAGIKPVLVTPLTRRYFQADGKIHSDLLAHADVTKRVAADMKVPVIDLQTESIAYLDKIGEAEGNKLGITKKDKDGKTAPDKTHLDWQGSYVFGRIVAADLAKVSPELKKYVLPKPAPLPPEGELAMRVIQGQPFKMVLVGDSTTATEGGWGPGFCATLTSNVTCVDLGANGRSTKSYIDEGLWTKALAEKGNYYTFQFGHNDQKDDPKRHTDAETSYTDNLRKFVRETRAIGAFPIILSPLSRRNYKEGKLVTTDGLKEYAAAARTVAAEEKVTFVDLLSMSQKYLSGMTQEEADTMDMVDHPDAKAENAGPAKPDRTHLNDKGKAVFGRMVADNVIRTQVELGPNVNGLPEGSTPAVVQQPSSTDGH